MIDFKELSSKRAVNRTIRIKGELSDKITRLSKLHEVSYSRVVNVLLAAALKDAE